VSADDELTPEAHEQILREEGELPDEVESLDMRPGEHLRFTRDGAGELVRIEAVTDDAPAENRTSVLTRKSPAKFPLSSCLPRTRVWAEARR
jgi:hypothetical protein